MSPQEKDTKDKILASALKLFAQDGFEGTSVRDLAQDAGVNLSAINYHFGGKDNVLIEITANFIESIQKFNEILMEPDSLDEFNAQLDFYIKSTIKHAKTNMTVLYVIMSEQRKLMSLKIEKLFQARQSRNQALVEYIKVAQKKNLINPKIDAEMFTNVFFHTLEGEIKATVLHCNVGAPSIIDDEYFKKWFATVSYIVRTAFKREDV